MLLAGEEGGVAAVVVLTVLFWVVVLILSRGCVVVRHTEVMVVERFGKYRETLKPGFHLLNPFADRPRMINWRYQAVSEDGFVVGAKQVTMDRVDLREHVIDFGRQHVITKDTVSIEIDALVYYQIVDPYAAILNISNLPDAIEMLTQSTLRAIIALMTLDDTFSSRERISAQLRERTLRDVERWGVTIKRVEIMNIIPPPEIKQAMELQIREERQRRALVAEADGARESKIIESYGTAARIILDATGRKEQRIRRANGEAESKRLLADAESRSISIISSVLSKFGVSAAEYLVANQYLNTLQALGGAGNASGGSRKGSTVVLVPRDALKVVGQLAGPSSAAASVADAIATK